MNNVSTRIASCFPLSEELQKTYLYESQKSTEIVKLRHINLHSNMYLLESIFYSVLEIFGRWDFVHFNSFWCYQEYKKYAVP